MYEVDPLKCEGCSKEVKLIAIIKDAISITKILTHLDEAVEAPKMQRARAPLEDVQIEQELGCDPEPGYHTDQTLSGWKPSEEHYSSAKKSLDSLLRQSHSVISPIVSLGNDTTTIVTQLY